MAEKMIRCCCRLPHLCSREKEPNVTHGLVDYPPQVPDAERLALYERYDELNRDGVPYYNTQEASEATRLFHQLTYPFNTAKAI